MNVFRATLAKFAPPYRTHTPLRHEVPVGCPAHQTQYANAPNLVANNLRDVVQELLARGVDTFTLEFAAGEASVRYVVPCSVGHMQVHAKVALRKEEAPT